MSRILNEYIYIFSHAKEEHEQIHFTHVKECYNFKKYRCCSCQYIVGVAVLEVSRDC